MRSVGSTIFILGIAILLREPGSAYSQDAFDNPAGTPPARLAALPTENTLRDALPMPSVPADLAQDTGFRDRERADFWQRMRPTFNLETEWLPASDEVGIFSYGAKMSIPTYPIFGPPPPLIQLGFSRTEFGQTGDQQLPADVSDFSFGLSWVRRLNERWTLRLMTTAAFASDGENTSGDAWQFRGGVFAIYSRDPEWIWTVGALALGRNDLPAVPALGLIWQPNDTVRLDLILPRPRFRMRLKDGESRQQWGYVGGGFSGGTWAYQQPGGTDDQLTYGDWRLVAGWESVPRIVPGVPFQRGRKLGFEAGYSFARDIEFESSRPTIDLEETFLLQATLAF